MATKKFYRYMPSKGYPLYWILFAYIVAGWFFPVVGWLAIICMIAPVAFAVKRGRWWCGNACPRGSMYDRLLAKYSPHRPIPGLCVRAVSVRLWWRSSSQCSAFRCTWRGATGAPWGACSGTSLSLPPSWASFSPSSMLRAHGARCVPWALCRRG